MFCLGEILVLSEPLMCQYTLCAHTENMFGQSTATAKSETFTLITLNSWYAFLNTSVIMAITTRLSKTLFHSSSMSCNNGEVFVQTLSSRQFKVALDQKRYDEVFHMIKHSRLCGQAIIAYLRKKGYPEVALYFVKDDRLRLNLALECGNLEIALEAAKALDDKECWNRLGAEALKQGNHQVVEMAYQRTKNFDKLSFLYLMTGNIANLAKMLKIAKMRNDIMSRFHNALYLGDVTERVAVLAEAGLLQLAYVLASSNGLENESAVIAQHLGSIPSDIISHEPQLLVPPVPILKEENWPLLTVSKGIFEGALDSSKKSESLSAAAAAAVGPVDVDTGAESSAWGEDLKLEEEGDSKDVEYTPGDDGPGGWDDDLQLPDIQVPTSSANAGSSSGGFAMPSGGVSFSQIWCQNSPFAVDHAAAGSFETAMQLLNKQLGLISFAPLKQNFLLAHTASSCQLGGMASAPYMTSPIQRNWADAGKRGGLPANPFTLPDMVEKLKNAYLSTTNGKFVEALTIFVQILHTIPFLIVSNKQELSEVKDLLGICREYSLGIKLELARKETQDNARQAELSAYFSHCNLQPIHLMLSLRSAMNCHYKVKNYSTAASFARRLLELNPKPDVATTARKVLQLCEQSGFSQELKIEYDERNPFTICGKTFQPIYKGKPSLRCSYCGTNFVPDCNGHTCTVCQIGQVGGEGTGLRVL
eukprot:TRINITY_DN2609_c0_g1_i3.p1 TRINITY_DN2609_c0_g1~~TRINITY_DN2609_c0_g1_i3.p1  ORF type:complete len:703 (+),score=132.82 TRINITY_DN2609_c0_g1_i3:1710-3818(+)